MSKYQRRDGLAGQSFQVPAIPRWDRRRKNTWLGSKINHFFLGHSRSITQPPSSCRRCSRIIPNTKAISIMWPCSIQPQPGVVRLPENTMRRAGNKMREQNRRLARVYEESTHLFVSLSLLSAPLRGPGCSRYKQRLSKVEASRSRD